MTEEEKKWFESLKRCLKKKPPTVEILVHEAFNGPTCCRSEIYLFKKGEIHSSQEKVGDLMKYSPNRFSDHVAVFDGIAANNHGY